MSARLPAPATALPRRVRPVINRSIEAVAYGAAPEALALPAGPILESIPWDGPEPDPDSLPAQSFLDWL
jgi:hypothetical protein